MKRTYPKKSIVTTILIFLFFSACAKATPIATSIPPTEVQPAVEFLDISQYTPSAEPVTPTSEPTQTPAPTFTPSPTQTEVAVATVTETKVGCVNQAEFVKHLNVSYNTIIKPGEFFAKLWQIRNTGTCTWTVDYHLVLVGGEPMQAKETISFPHEVLPQETVDLRVDLVAPVSPNFYENSWMLQDQDGNLFGLGSDQSEPLWVKIQVPQIYSSKSFDTPSEPKKTPVG